MIRILHVLGALHIGGAESRIMDLYRKIDKERIQFDFVVHTKKAEYFEKEICEMGGRVFRVPAFRVYNIFSYRKAFKKLFKEHPEFKMVQGHMTSTASIFLPIAKKYGNAITIAHARSAGVDKGPKGALTKILRRNLYKRADYLFSCSKLAGKAVFGEMAEKEKDIIFIPNAIDAAKYRYNEEIRQQMREELEVGEHLVIGHVGSFRYAKNHEYLLKIFAELLKNNDRYEGEKSPLFLLLGEGGLMEDMKDLAEQLGISAQVRFLGNRMDIWKYYQAFDFLVFPSRYEGMPGTVLEAQAAGLKCIMSDQISDDTMITDLVKQKSISVEPKEWAECIWKELPYERRDTYAEIAKAGFDVVLQAENMMQFYEKTSLR